MLFVIGISILTVLLIILIYRIRLVNKQYFENKTRNSSDEIAGLNVYEQLINTVSDVIYSSDIYGNFTYTNSAVTRLLGYDKEEIIGLQFHEIIHPSHKVKIRQHYKEHYKKKIKQSYHEFIVQHKNGSTLWVGQEVTTRFNEDDPEIIDGFYGIVRNINARKEAEILLQESESRYRELFDNSSELIHSVDAKGKILYANKAWRQKLGYTEDELDQLNYFSIIHPESLENYSQLINEVIVNSRFEGIIIYDIVTKNGSKISVEGSLNVTKKANDILTVQSFLRDITLQKEAEVKLTKQERTLRQITETLNDVFYLYNIKDSKYEYISPNCEKILGVSTDFFHSNQSYMESFVNGMFKDKLSAARKDIQIGKPYDVDFQIIIGDEIRWINEKSFPVLNKQREVVANSGICRDISDLKLAEAIINSQNIEMGSSIEYAKNIQEAVLPTREHVTSIFEDSFVFFRPKDTVSGDFYIVDHIKSNRQIEMPTFIVGDCTGHGVPGAVLSLMCNVLIRESFTQQGINSPAEALDFVRNRLISFFGAQRSIRDGMDIAFCVLNKEERQLYFAGAYISCVLIRGTELREYKSDKQHVGYVDNPKPFNNVVIDLEKGDCIYLYTDGYIDQFGGERNKKFMRNRLHNLLREISHLSMLEIEKELEESLKDWQKDYDQIDDITVMGIRVE